MTVAAREATQVWLRPGIRTTDGGCPGGATEAWTGLGTSGWYSETDGGCPGRRGRGFARLTVAARDDGGGDEGGNYSFAPS